MTYDVRTSAREREKKKQTSVNDKQEVRNSAYDVRESARRREAGEIVGTLSTQINKWLDNSGKYIAGHNSRFAKRDNSKYISDADQWLLNSMAQKNGLDKERDSILSAIKKYEPYMNSEWVKTVKTVMENSSYNQDGILAMAKQDAYFWKNFADENDYNNWKQYSTMTPEELKEAQSSQTKSRYEEKQKRIEENQNKIAELQKQRGLVPTNAVYNPDSNFLMPIYDPATSQIKAIDDKIAELKAENRKYESGSDASVAYTMSDGTKVTWVNLYDNAYRQKYQGKTYEQLKEILATMEDGDEKEWLTAYAPTTATTAQDYDSELTKVSSELESLKAELNQLVNVGGADFFTDEEISRGQYLQNTIEKLSQRKAELEGKRKYNFLYQNEDFAEQSKYVSTAAEDWLAKTFSELDLGYSDLTYEYINNQDGIRDKIRHKQATYRNDKNNFEIYDNLTEDETATFNYLYSTEGKESAYAYLEYLEPELNARKQNETRQEKAAFATEHPHLADLESVGATLVSGVGALDALGQKIKNDITGDYYKPIDWNTDAMTASIVSSTIRGTRAQNLADQYGTIQIDEAEHPILSRLFNGKSLGDVYQLGMSMVDSTATALLSPVLGSASTLLLAGSSATQTMLSAAENGASDDQALWMGALSGAFEFLFEKYELESLLENGSDSVVRALFKQSLSEGFGEGMTTIANFAADSLVMADKSELNRTIAAYREQHPDWSEEKLRNEALKDMAIQTGWDIIGGAASGSIMGGGYSAINKGIDKIHSLAQEKVDAEQRALQRLAETTVGDENLDLPLKTNPMSIKEQLRKSQDTLNQMQPAAEIQIPKHFSELDIAGKINWVIEKLRPTGYVVERKELGTIKFGRKQLKGAFNYFDKGSVEEAAFEALPYVLKNGVEISEHTNHKDREYGTVTIAAPVTIDGQRGNMAVVVKKTTENFYKVHRILTPDGAVFELSATENEAELTPAGESPETGSLATPISSASINIISETEPGVNGDSSSLQGKTFLRNTDQEVQVRNFADLGGGNATVKLADGTIAAEKDIFFADDAENVLFHFVAREDGMIPKAANAIWGLWQANKQSTDPIPADAFRDSAFAVWRAGVRGDETILSSEDKRASALTDQQKEIIYEAGRKTTQGSTDAAQKNVNAIYEQAKAVLQQKGKTSNKTYRAVTTRGVYVKDMSPSQKASFLMAQRIAPAVKADIEVYNGGKEWGYYDSDTDKICLNINAKWNNQTMLAFTLAHELVHRAKVGSPAQFQAFADFLVKKFGEQGSDIEAMVREQLDAANEYDKTVPEGQRIHMTEDMAFEEVVADACQRMLLDTDAGNRLAEFGAQSEQNRNFLKRFAKWLRELLENLRNAFKGVTPDSLAAKEFAKFEENVKQTLADMFVKMNIDAGEKLSTIKEAGLTEKITTENGGVKYSLNKNAKSELHKALYDTKYRNDVLLRDGTPAIMLAQKGVRNLPMAMKASHIRENVFSIEEAVKLGLPTSKDINYHGLGEALFLKIIDGLDDVKEAYRGTKNADNPTRRENYFLLISEFADGEGNIVNVPVYIDEHTQYNRVFIDINKISTVFGKRDIHNYIARQVKNGNLVRIKNKSNLTSERSAPIAEGYGKIASTDSIRNSEQNVNENFKELVGSPKKLPVSKDISDRAMLVDMFEQMVTDSNEYKVLQNYKNHMDEMLALEEKVERLTAEIGRLSFAEGPRDMEYINNLKLQKKQAINRLNYYDNKLLGLEKSGVLKAMIERNRQKVTQESFDRAKEHYKERGERREAEIRQYYRESRRKAIERHDMAEVRQQIRKDVQRLDSLLNKGTKNKNVKLGLQEFVGSALRLAKGTFLTDYNEYDMIRSGLKNSLLPEEQAAFRRCRELLEELDKLRDEQNAQPGADNFHEKWDPEAELRREDREAALKKELSQNMRVLRDGNVFQRERAGTEQATAEELLSELMSAYKALENSEREHIRGVYNEELYKQIDKVRNFLAGKAIKDMNSVELKELQKMYRMVSHTVSKANEFFGNRWKQNTRQRGEKAYGQLQSPVSRDMPEFLEKVASFGWSIFSLDTAMEIIGSDVLIEHVQELYDAEDTYQRDLEHAREFAEEQAEKYKRKDWKLDQKVSFAGTEITLGQVMSLYAYSRRKQGQGHLEGDGFVHSKNVRIKKNLFGKLPVQLGYVKNATQNYKVTREMYGELEKLLTVEQREYVKAMQEYLSKVMGAKGNEVSQELHGIPLFEETIYFPLKTAKVFSDTALGATTGERKLKNTGFTEAAKKGADNAIVLDDFERVWSEHVNEMSNYHAYVLAIENFNRVYNYRHAVEQAVTDAAGEVYKTELVDTNESVKLAIEKRTGSAANAYIVKYMQNLNGGVRSDATEALANGLLGNFRKTRVLGSGSVIVQQPAAFLRAMAKLDVQDLAGWKQWRQKHQKPPEGLMKEMYRYCPVAGLKKMGGFDPSMGRTARQYLFNEYHDGENPLQRTTGWVNEKLGMLPEAMDEITWTYIWYCSKQQTLRKHPDLRAGSKEFCEEAAKLFSQIIRETQVYDSVMVKPKILQSKSAWVKSLTSFMNEPLKGLNQVIRAWVRVKHGKTKARQAVRETAAVYAAELVAGALSAFFYAFRDDDDDETYWEKYLSALTGKAWEGLFPLYKLPYIKDVISLIEGYRADRSDTALVKEFLTGLENVFKPSNATTPEEKEKEVWDRLEKGYGYLLNFIGIPGSNLIREIRGIYRTAKKTLEKSWVESTDTGTKYALIEGLPFAREFNKQKQLENAIVEDDTEHLVRVIGTWENQDTALSNLRAAIKDVWLSEKITDDKAKEYLAEFAGIDRAKAPDYIAKWEFRKTHPGLELTDAQILGWVEYAEPAGISLEAYTRYVEQTEGLTSEKDKDGDPIPGSKQKKIVDVIHAQPLTRKQKDALYLAEGYAESNLKDAPWN